MSDLQDQLAVVTGASRGIGLAIAQRFEQAGARHVVRLARTLSTTSAERHTDLRCDVTQDDEVGRAARHIFDTLGTPDILVNNAGAFLLKPVQETSTAEFLEQVNANLLGAFFLMRAFLPWFVERGSGQIVNVGSVADHEAYPGNAAYGASKYGLRGLHETVRAELAGSGVRLSLISPGPTDTALWDGVDAASDPTVRPRASMLRPDDVADAVLFAVTRPPHVSIDWMWVNPG